MNESELLIEGFDRIKQSVHGVLDDLPAEALAYRIEPGANTIAWLIWHLTRVQDDHIADVAELQQIWTGQGWAERIELPFPAESIGFGHTADEVAQVRPDAEFLAGYHDAVYQQTIDYLAAVDATDLDRIVDDRWDPPVTLGVRLISVLNDDLQHVGQAAYVRGIFERRD